jgi:hypothetical protein
MIPLFFEANGERPAIANLSVSRISEWAPIDSLSARLHNIRSLRAGGLRRVSVEALIALLMRVRSFANAVAIAVCQGQPTMARGGLIGSWQAVSKITR